MADGKKKALWSTRVLLPEGERPAGIILSNGKIEGILPEPSDDFEMVDLDPFVVAPGIVDTHVHVNEPGRTEWEGFETATQAAAAGGITTIVDMPLNCDPVTTTLAAFEEKLNAVSGKLHVDAGFYGGVIPGNEKDIAPLAEKGVLGFKAFLIDSGLKEFPAVDAGILEKTMPIIARFGLPLLVHAELESATPPPQESYSSYLQSRPSEWEERAVELMIALCQKHKCRTHIVHLSSSKCLTSIREAKRNGLPLTVETCPHYLCLTAEEISDGETHFKCAPPIREGENREQLWNALQEGAIDLIVSDHSPCLPEMKVGDFSQAWGGISSLQFGLPSIWTSARERFFSCHRLTELMSRSPAEFVGLGHRKGRLTPGYDADIVVWDPNDCYDLDPAMVLHRHKVSPYIGRTLFGRVVRTYVRGQLVVEDGQIMSEPTGQSLLRSHNV